MVHELLQKAMNADNDLRSNEKIFLFTPDKEQKLRYVEAYKNKQGILDIENVWLNDHAIVVHVYNFDFASVIRKHKMFGAVINMPLTEAFLPKCETYAVAFSVPVCSGYASPTSSTPIMVAEVGVCIDKAYVDISKYTDEELSNGTKYRYYADFEKDKSALIDFFAILGHEVGHFVKADVYGVKGDLKFFDAKVRQLRETLAAGGDCSKFQDEIFAYNAKRAKRVEEDDFDDDEVIALEISCDDYSRNIIGYPINFKWLKDSSVEYSKEIGRPIQNEDMGFYNRLFSERDEAQNRHFFKKNAGHTL